MSDRGATGFSNQAMLDQLLAGPYAHFTKVGEDDYRDRSERNPSMSLSSKGYFNHRTGENGYLSKLAADAGLDVSHMHPHVDRSITQSVNKTEKSASDKAAYLWKKALNGEQARTFIEDYLTNVRQIPPENYIDLIDGGQLRFLPGEGKYPPALVHPFYSIEQNGSIREEICKIHLTYKEGTSRKKQLGCDGHLTVLPPMDPANADKSILATEGLENALSLRQQYSCKRIVVTGSKSNLKHLVRLAQCRQDVLIIADHDGHAKPHENGQFEAASVRKQLMDKGVNCVAIMPMQPNWDANAALQVKKQDEWINSLVEAPELDSYSTNDGESNNSRGRIRIVRRSQMNFPKRSWLIEGLLEMGTLATIAGQPESGKSFIALDLACSIQAGRPWHGIKVQQGNVLYFHGEGRGIESRLIAWEHYHQIEQVDIYLNANNWIDLADSSSNFELLLGVLSRDTQGLKLIVVDTLSRFSTADENSAKEVSRLIRNLDQLRLHTGATILIIHHSAKNSPGGLRGSSAIEAAIDHHFNVSKTEGYSKLSSAKTRDSTPFQPMYFELHKVSRSEVNSRDDFGLLVPILVNSNKLKTSIEKGKDKNFTSNQETFIETFEMLASHNGGNSKVSEDELRKHMRKKVDGFSTSNWRDIKKASNLKKIFRFENDFVEKI